MGGRQGLRMGAGMARDDANEDDAPYIVIEERPSDLGPFLLGAALGVAIALLLAPRSGADTRNAVRQKLRSARRTAQQAAEGVATSSPRLGRNSSIESKQRGRRSPTGAVN